MTGGIVVVLGPVGANFGAGMTGGRAYLYDPSGRHAAALHGPSVRAVRLAEVVAEREDGRSLAQEFRDLVEDHREAGSELAARLITDGGLDDAVWLVEPIAAPVVAIEPASPRVTQPSVSEPARPFVAAS
jgi:glutamate synthase domain-containing protein 3